MLDNKIVFLQGKSFFLRPIEQSDLTREYVQWLNDEEICRYNSHATFPYTMEKMNDYFASLHASSNTNIVLAIIDNESNNHIGNACLQSIDWISRSAEFAILLGDRNFWGKGLATDVAALLYDYGFTRLNLHRIHLGTSSKNIGMQKIAQKLRMTQEGVRREAMYKNGSYVDIIEYGVLKSEFYN